MKHIIMFSGGAASFVSAKRVIESFGPQDVILLFADTKMEDEDLYRFLDDTESHLGVPITRISDGRTPWEVFFDVRFLGNSRVDPCSMILKRKLLDRWIKDRFKPDECIVYVGIDLWERHRYDSLAPRKLPYIYKSPLLEKPWLMKQDMLEILKQIGIKPPRLYSMGFEHNNCGGFCIKAGKKHFKMLLENMRDRYIFHEEKESEIRDFLGKDVSILKETMKGEKKYITLREFRIRLESSKQDPLFLDEIDIDASGGCGCMIDESNEGETCILDERTD